MADSYLNLDGLAYAFTKIKALIYKGLGMQGVITTGDGAAYTATVKGISELTAGATFVMVPHVASTVVMPTLDVNGLGAKAIRRRVSNSTVTTVAAGTENWLAANKPVRVMYDGTYWIADLDRPNANDIYGTVAIANGGTGASTAEGVLTNLGISATAEELSFVHGVKSAIQTQLDGKAENSHTHNIAAITSGSADDITVPLTLLDIRTENDDLHTMLTGNGSVTENYAYIHTIFLDGSSNDRSRTQVAVGYQCGYTAVRSYYGGTGGIGWSKWNMLLGNQLNNYSYGPTLPAAGTKGRIFFKKVSG